MGNSFYAAVERQNAAQREIAQSISRPARIRFTVRVKGAGETRLKDTLDFGTYIIGEPTFQYGCVATHAIRDGEFPLATAVVSEWVTNDRGMYVAAKMLFRIDCFNEEVELTFNLTFEGFALRTTAAFQAH